MNKVLDVRNLANKVLEPDEVHKVLDIEDEVLDINLDLDTSSRSSSSTTRTTYSRSRTPDP